VLLAELARPRRQPPMMASTASPPPSRMSQWRGVAAVVSGIFFRRPVFRVAALVGYVTVIAFFGAEFLLPVYLQVVQHEPALRVGLVMLPLALGTGLLLPIAGAAYDRIGPRTLVVGGFALLIYNTWQLANLNETTSLAFIVRLTAIRGIALGLTVQTPFTAALADVTHAALPRATSFVLSSRYLVQAYGIPFWRSGIAPLVHETRGSDNYEWKRT
jgi:hypothetical protein